MTRTRLSLYALAASIGTAAAPVGADPSIGVGFSLSFGGADEFAAALGVDYVFTTQSLRPTIGAAYLMEDSYAGLDVGYNYTLGVFDVGGGVGLADTDDN